MLRLVLRSADRTQVFAVPGVPQVLGSAAACGLRFAVRGVSRQHARLVGVGDGLQVDDVGSRNGLWFAGERRERVVLRPGERLQIGEAWLSVEEVSTSDAEPELRLPATPTGSSFTAAAPDGKGTETVGAGVAAGRGAFPALLHLVRLLERQPLPAIGSGRERLLDEVRRAVDATALLVFRVVAGEMALAELAGATPADGLLDALASAANRAPGAAGARRLAPAEGSAVLATSSSGWALAVLPASPAAAVEPGRVDLVAYLGERLLRLTPEATPASAEGVEPRHELYVPAGMVVGSSGALAALLHDIRATIASPQHVLLQGESGTGKELFARLIHDWSPHAKGRFVAVNCAAIAGEQFEAEMFGIIKGAATGVDARLGHFARADGGTLFLDEVGELRDDHQGKLLRVLQEREVAPVGASAVRRIDVRVLAASNRDLAALVAAGRFRQDLYYRLSGLTFRIPPLRERREDLPELALTFIARFAAKHHRPVLGVSRRALRALAEHDWPGNIRELENACERAVLRCPRGAAVGVEHFAGPPAARPPIGPAAPSLAATQGGGATGSGDAGTALRARVEDVERRALIDALDHCAGIQSQAAKLLGMSRYGLRLKMRRLGVERPADR
jgi:DNA-binding NtrC family response regulator